MKCPRCDDHPALATLTKKGVVFHGCRTCKGLLLDKDTITRLVNQVHASPDTLPVEGDDYFNRLVTASEFVPDNKASMSCPHCRYDMYETENRGVRLDFCMNCQAMWFDLGELQAILQRLRKGETFSLVPLPMSEVDHASGLILQILRDDWLA